MTTEREGDTVMSERSFTRLKLISITVFILGLVSAALALSLHQTNGKKLRHRKGFTLITKQTSILNSGTKDGLPLVTQTTTVRYQKSDGTWRQVRTYRDADGKVVKKDIGVGIPGQGVFKLNKGRGTLEFLSSMPTNEASSYIPIKDWHADPNFLKDDWVQGYQTHVLRFLDPDGGYIDFYFASELDDQAVRHVSVSPNGVAIEELFEIKPGDPDERAFGSLPKWLVNYDLFKEEIATMEERGNHETAEAMRRELAEHIARQPDE
jgi:hypothetical protein